MLKSKEKEVHDLGNKFHNSQDSNLKLKDELSEYKRAKHKLEKNIKTLERKVMKLETVVVKKTVSMQTCCTIDTPYNVEDPLPPIFSSQLCYPTKPIFLSRSSPDVSKLIWVSTSEEEKIRDLADAALDEMYDQEVKEFYLEARRKAAADRVGD